MPFPGIVAELVDATGKPLRRRAAGSSSSTQPWPGMLRTIYGDDERYQETYWSRFPGRYFTGDGAKLDEDGYFWILGRVDDVLNVAGHRIGTMEVESALVDHPAVAEAAVVGRPTSSRVRRWPRSSPSRTATRRAHVLLPSSRLVPATRTRVYVTSSPQARSS